MGPPSQLHCAAVQRMVPVEVSGTGNVACQCGTAYCGRPCSKVLGWYSHRTGLVYPVPNPKSESAGAGGRKGKSR